MIEACWASPFCSDAPLAGAVPIEGAGSFAMAEVDAGTPGGGLVSREGEHRQSQRPFWSLMENS